MTVLFITPDYPSHYNPLVPLGKVFQSKGEKVVFATGSALAERVSSDGFSYTHLVVGDESNTGLISLERQEKIAEEFEASRAGMTSMLRHEAKTRLRDLLWKPIEVTQNVKAILQEVRPRFTINVHLGFNVTLALLALEVPFATFVTAHPAQLPAENEVYGFPYLRPKLFQASEEDLLELEQLCREVQERFTDGFNQVLQQLRPGLPFVPNALAAASSDLILFNYPKELMLDRKRLLPPSAHFIGSSVRHETLDNQLETWLNSNYTELPTVYISFGTYYSTRSDVLGRIVQALRDEPIRVLFASGNADPNQWGPIPTSWYVRKYFPQAAVLSTCDLVISHGGNNTITESLNFGAPLLLAPFATDQFAGAASIERSELGAVFDPNKSSVDEIHTLFAAALSAHHRAASLGTSLREQPGPLLAYALCESTFA